MLLEGMRRNEYPIVSVRMGGYPTTVVDRRRQGKPVASLTFVELNPIDERARNRIHSANGVILASFNSVELADPRGRPFTEQAMTLVVKCSRLLDLFPVEWETLAYEVLVRPNNRTRWMPAIDLLREDFESRKLVYASFPIKYERGAEGYTHPVVLVVQSNLQITHRGFHIEEGQTTEKLTGMPAQDECYILSVWMDAEEAIESRLRESAAAEKLPIEVSPPKNSQGQRVTFSYRLTAPMSGKQMMSWIIKACLACGVIFPHTALIEHGLTPTGDLIVDLD